jgi:SAM-dependent methyltransferase
MIDHKNVLELACGIGRYRTFFAEHAQLVIVNDLMQEFVQENKMRHSAFNNIIYHAGDAVNLIHPEWNCFFDFVFINWLFLCLSDDECVELVGKLKKWMRAGALLFSRESCCPSVSGMSQGLCARYREPEQYEGWWERTDFELLSSGHIKLYEKVYRNPHQRWWMWRKLTNSLDSSIPSDHATSSR